MKTEIFSKAILNRNRIQILYEYEEKVFEPYYLSLDSNGEKWSSEGLIIHMKLR